MPKTKNTSKIDDDIEKKMEQLSKIEERLKPLQGKCDKLISEIKSLKREKDQIRYSELVGVLQGVQGIDNLSVEQIQETLQKAAESLSSTKPTLSDKLGS